ncbi:DMT family transporter [uncultured Clostridium sp.]|uniref:DMT family transporter n=1 Tax=uncultured Clostridium sp. TaxID=59620 RepID=UPI0028E99742|nr:DMT family transporter [uncultured Clostridium sp.]
MDSTKKGSLLVLVAVILWSITGIITKTVNTSAIWINLIRSLSGGIFLSPFIFKQKIYPLKNVLIASVFMALFLMALTLTTQISSSAMAISMQYAAPMYVIAYGFYKNKRIDYKKLMVLILIFIGVFLNVLDSFKSANIIAIFSGLAIGITFILYSATLQKIESGSPLGIVALINLVCSFFYILVLPFNYTNVPSSLKDILLLCLAGVLVSGLSYALYGAGLRKIKVEKAMIIALAEPVLNPIWVFLGNKEIPEAMTIVGVIFILLGAVADILFKKHGSDDTGN